VLDAQVRRMLRDPKASALVDNFAGAVAARAQPAQRDADKNDLPGLRRQPAAGVRARAEAVRRQHHREDRSVLD
jgi:hypothetical protein